MNTATAPVRAEQPSEPFGVKRVLLLVFGGIAVLLALALLAGGGAGIWAPGERDSSGLVLIAGGVLIYLGARRQRPPLEAGERRNV